MSQTGLPQCQEIVSLSYFISLFSPSTLLKRPCSKALWEVAHRPVGEESEGWWGEEFPQSTSIKRIWLNHPIYFIILLRCWDLSDLFLQGSGALISCRSHILSCQGKTNVIEMQKLLWMNICIVTAHPESYQTVAFTSDRNTSTSSFLSHEKPKLDVKIAVSIKAEGVEGHIKLRKSICYILTIFDLSLVYFPNLLLAHLGNHISRTIKFLKLTLILP